jgi:class 3 adenylate cyclase
MDEHTVIQFPTERRLQAAARQRAEAPAAAQAAPAEQPQTAGEPFALLSIEIRRMPRTESRIGADIASRILNRCVLASLEVLAKEKTPVDLSGTVLRPVIEATFAGDDGVSRAARTVVALRQVVAKVQRDAENEFHLFGAITTGTTSVLEDGVVVTTGTPEQLAARFREHAAPGQVLVSEVATTRLEDQAPVSPHAVEVTFPGHDPVPAYPLNLR